MQTARVHRPALGLVLPTAFGTHQVRLAVPQRDRLGCYPTWTVLCHRPDDDEYVVWNATYDDDHDGEWAWTVEAGSYYGRSWYGEDHARDAYAKFWERARAAAWRPDGA